MSSGTLFGIGVGPGDPELLTLKAVDILRNCRHVFAPRSSPGADSVALAIARRHIRAEVEIEPIDFPMTRDRGELRDRWDAAASRVCAVLRQGKDACFLTLGDPLLYSTYIYLLRGVQRRLATVKIVTVPGVTAFSAAAALANFPVGEGKQPVRIVPTADDLTRVEDALAEGGTVVLMKIGKRLGAILDLLDRAGRIDDAVLVARAGMPDQRIETDLRKLSEETNDLGYLSVILVNAGFEGQE
jgi:precorrin-2/cobalt-factor-2 C20-methyltransferase